MNKQHVSPAQNATTGGLPKLRPQLVPRNFIEGGGACAAILAASAVPSSMKTPINGRMRNDEASEQNTPCAVRVREHSFGTDNKHYLYYYFSSHSQLLLHHFTSQAARHMSNYAIMTPVRANGRLHTDPHTASRSREAHPELIVRRSCDDHVAAGLQGLHSRTKCLDRARPRTQNAQQALHGARGHGMERAEHCMGHAGMPWTWSARTRHLECAAAAVRAQIVRLTAVALGDEVSERVLVRLGELVREEKILVGHAVVRRPAPLLGAGRAGLCVCQGACVVGVRTRAAAVRVCLNQTLSLSRLGVRRRALMKPSATPWLRKLSPTFRTNALSWVAFRLPRVVLGVMVSCVTAVIASTPSRNAKIKGRRPSNIPVPLPRWPCAAQAR